MFVFSNFLVFNSVTSSNLTMILYEMYNILLVTNEEAKMSDLTCS